MKSSRTDNEKAGGLLQGVLPYCISRRRPVFAEIVIKPCALELATCMLGGQSRNEVGIVHFCSNNVRYLIQKLSADIQKQLVSSKFFHQLMHKRIALKGVLKFTFKQVQHVSVQSPSSRSALFELTKVTVVKIIN